MVFVRQQPTRATEIQRNKSSWKAGNAANEVGRSGEAEAPRNARDLGRSGLTENDR